MKEKKSYEKLNSFFFLKEKKCVKLRIAFGSSQDICDMWNCVMGLVVNDETILV